jgi:hypothetical protein
MYSVGDKIISVGNKFPEKKVRTLTFQVKGTEFPDTPYSSLSELGFDSNLPNSVVVNYGDGNSVVKEFVQDGNEYRVGYRYDGNSSNVFPDSARIENHTYTDNNSGPRFITFTFQNAENIYRVYFNTVVLIGSLPKELNFFKGLKIISLNRVYELSDLNINISKNLEIFSLSASVLNRFDFIADSVFQSNLTKLKINGAFNLGDNISSNFFKVNQLSDTLTELAISSTLNISLPFNEIKSLSNLTSLECINNPYQEMQSAINELTGLETLYHGSSINKEFDLINFNNLNNIGTLLLKFASVDFSSMTQNWKGLKSLFRFLQFKFFVRSTQKFNEFIDVFYQLCTENGFLDPSSTEAQNTGFPEQFRDISWGDGDDWFTVTNPIQAPSGFSQGVSNGTPANNAEKIYVLVENYGHSVTLAS